MSYDLNAANMQMTRVFAYANRVFPHVWPLLEDNEGRKGYWLSLRYGPNHFYFMRTEIVGKPDMAKEEKCARLSRKKITIAAEAGVITSMQRRNPEVNDWGGGMDYAMWGSGISALKEADDHCLVIAQSMRTGLCAFAPFELQHTVVGDVHWQRYCAIYEALPEFRFEDEKPVLIGS